MGDDRDRPYRRIGNATECPACGWGMSPNAYRCPKCYIYFCFKCRTQVREREPQFQCADQACPQHGKLLCAACTVMVPEFRDVTRSEYDTVPDQPEKTVEVGDNWGYATFIVPIVAGIASKGFETPTIACIVVFAFFVMRFILVQCGSTWFVEDKVIPATTKRVYRNVTENQQVAEHRSCIQCRHPIKVLK